MDVTIESAGTPTPSGPGAPKPGLVPTVGVRDATDEDEAVVAAQAVALDQAELDRELRLVDAAISMVWRGVAHRVTLASMALAHEVLDAAQARAGLYRLRVRTASDVEGGPLAVIVERAEG